jgi:hypothetical protein
VIIAQASLVKPQTLLEPLIQECDELISIFVKSIKTATSKNNSIRSGS